MAQTMQRNVVDDFETISAQLVREISDYVASGQEDEQTSANIRRIRVASGSLQGALQSVQMMPPRPQTAPMPPPDAPMPTSAPQSTPAQRQRSS